MLRFVVVALLASCLAGSAHGKQGEANITTDPIGAVKFRCYQLSAKACMAEAQQYIDGTACGSGFNDAAEACRTENGELSCYYRTTHCQDPVNGKCPLHFKAFGMPEPHAVPGASSAHNLVSPASSQYCLEETAAKRAGKAGHAPGMAQ